MHFKRFRNFLPFQSCFLSPPRVISITVNVCLCGFFSIGFSCRVRFKFQNMNSVLCSAVNHARPLFKPSLFRASVSVIHSTSPSSQNFSTVAPQSLRFAQQKPIAHVLPALSNNSQQSLTWSGIFSLHPHLSEASKAASFSTSSSGTPMGATSSNNGEDKNNSDKNEQFSWIDKEAHELIQKAYSRHKALADKSQAFPPSLSVDDLERIGTPYHYPPQDFIDRLALNMMKFLRVFVHAFFREKYQHHAVCLETVAAVPGMVGSFHRHLRSLRRMQRDHGWITVLQEEAENERMHLLIFMKVCQPTLLERGFVMLAQGIYLTFYSTLYLVNSRAAHRLTGYLEEEAHRVYTEYLQCLDEGRLRNVPAPNIAKQYYHLADDALIRDVVLHVRADEAMHRDVNHQFGNMYAQGRINEPIHRSDEI